MTHRTNFDGRNTKALRIGDRFGRIMVVRVFKKGILPYAECLCFECARLFEAPQTRVRCGKRLVCPRCSFLKAKTGGKNKLPPHEKFLRLKEAQYIHSARVRKYLWDLDRETFRSIFQGTCHYCGALPAHGIDRRDNQGNYTLDNAVPCCTQCNYSKRAMPEQDFLDWIARIAAFQGFTL